jgi:hypothetical protein
MDVLIDVALCVGGCSMVKVIPARIENGRVIPSEPLPEDSTIEGVSLLLKLKPKTPETGRRSSVLSELRGILQGKVSQSDHDLNREYAEYLEAKYR